MAGKDESFSMKPCVTGSMEAEGAVTGEEGSLTCRAGKKYALKPCNQEGGRKSLEEFFLLKPCTNGSMAAATAFSGKEFSLTRCTNKSMVGINGEPESSLKLCPDEGVDMESVTAEEQCSLKLCPTERMSMSVVTAEEECSLKICPIKRKSPTTGHLHALKGGASKRKAGDYCFQGDIAATDAATVEASETKCLQFQGDSLDDSEDEEVEEEVEEEEGDDNKEEDSSDGNEIISDEEFQLTLAENNEIVRKYVEGMFVGRDWGLSESMDIFLSSEDEGELDDARVDALE